MIISSAENICDDNGIEILVGYDVEKTKEVEFGDEEATTLIYTELTSVEVVIKGRGIDILPLLHPNQKEYIISKLQYE